MYKDLKTESVESLSAKIVVISGRVEELTSELLNKTEEARQLKVTFTIQLFVDVRKKILKFYVTGGV